MSRIDIVRQIAILDALELPGAPLVGKAREERERLIAELDHFDDTRWDAQKKMLRRDAHRGRGGIPQMRYDIPVDADSRQRLMGAARYLWAEAMYDHEMQRKIDMTARLHPEEYDLSYGLTPQEIEATYFHRYNLHNWETDPYYRGPGRPGNDPPQGPLYEVYLLVRVWWQRYTGKTKFKPTYNGPRREDFNAAGRLFLHVAQALDARYTPRDCASVYEKWRKRRQ